MGGWILFTVGAGWGLWWLLMPGSVARFYERVHSYTMMPEQRAVSPTAIRIAGGLWLVLVAVAGFLLHRFL